MFYSNRYDLLYMYKCCTHILENLESSFLKKAAFKKSFTNFLSVKYGSFLRDCKTSFFFYEAEKKIKTNHENARVVALKEASFKAMSNLYHQKRIKITMFDFEITKDIIPHGKSRSIIVSMDANIKTKFYYR